MYKNHNNSLKSSLPNKQNGKNFKDFTIILIYDIKKFKLKVFLMLIVKQ